jgi:hypothetical protein
MVTMKAKFEWFGFSIARQHVYFYMLLIATTLCANTMKESLLGSPVFVEDAREKMAHWTEQFRAAEQSLESSQ